MIAEAGRRRLPPPEINGLVEGFKVDLVWREQHVAVELDGWDTHRTRAAFERDRARDRALTLAGWRTLRIAHRQRAEGIADLAALLAASGCRSG